jgi:hypothetical protein
MQAATMRGTHLLASNGTPGTDDVPDHTSTISSDTTENIEKYSKPALSLGPQESYILRCGLRRDGAS